ncbi:matrix metalloproteinase-2-like isoform X1 [Schistocerca piceifrons]|uniref:matrix metalloproteinase-2-like isoform X1 n=1 Tax=Schistocerca piceifrons TaxID=274613 RepID=UPI001F5E683E|nr:matrix metalloproteinase-2-like isoform X1 [Schistocerca piceifrons]
MRRAAGAATGTATGSPPLLLPLLLLLALLAGASSAPRSHLYVDDRVQNYLMRYGYLPQSDKETGNLRTEEQLRDALRELQRYGHIPVTGELDEETRRLLQRPRCAVADVPYREQTLRWGRRKHRHKRYSLQGNVWPTTNLTWSLRTMEPRDLDPGMVRYQLDRALRIWSDNSRLTFREVNSDRADILVYFHRLYHGDGFPFDGRGQILAHAFFPGEGRGGDAHFDEDEIWLLGEEDASGQGTSLFAVAAHEFGHSLGLQHSSVKGALMYPWYQGLSPNYKLPDDDRVAIQQLYGAKERLWAKIPTYPYDRDRDRGAWPTPHPTAPPTQPPPPPPPPPPPTQPPTPPPTPPTRPTRPPWRPPKSPKHDKPRHRQPPPPPPTYRPRTRPPPPTLPPPRPSPAEPRTERPQEVKPDTCNTNYDAISVIRREVFIFKDKYFWRIGDRGLEEGYPAEIQRFWYSLPRNFTHVDAVYERLDKKIVFFIGRQYFVYDANTLMHGYPRPLTDLGLPETLDRVDAAMVWGHNKKTYFYSGTMYWRFDEDVGKVELDYPRDMSMWRGVGYNVDAVFQWKDGKTYFFKGKGFWKFNDQYMRVESEKPMQSSVFWMGCPPGIEGEVTGSDGETNEIDELDHHAEAEVGSEATSFFNGSITVLLTIALLCFQVL